MRVSFARLIFAICALILSGVPDASAQNFEENQAPSLLRPFDDAVEGAFGEGEEEPAQRVLPPLSDSIWQDDRNAEAGSGANPSGSALEGGTLQISGISIEGNTVLGDEEFRAAAEPFLNRELTSVAVEALRDALTGVLIRAGYRTSGAIFPEQAIRRDGVLRVQIIEGVLSAVNVQGERFVWSKYFSSRLLPRDGEPLHVPQLEERIRRLQRDPRLKAIHATIRPADAPGESVLEVSVKEASPLAAFAEIHNAIAPSLGEIRGSAGLLNRSLLGFGDEFRITGDLSEAGGGVEARYEFPLHRSGTKLMAQGRYREFALSDGIGNELGIESEFWSAEIGLSQPFFPTREWSFSLGLVGDLRESRITDGLGEGFEGLLIPGAKNGRARVAALRFFADATLRQLDRVFAIRSVASFGIKAFGSTRNEEGVPESQSVSWFVQAQAVQRVTDWKIELVGKAAFQLANRPLLGLEQFAIGGFSNLRGYRQNQLVRDEGARGTVEVRVPLIRGAVDGQSILQAVAFVDAGRVWSRHSTNGNDRAVSLASMGLGTRFLIRPHFRGEFYWAHGFRELTQDGQSLQDNGIHFRFITVWP